MVEVIWTNPALDELDDLAEYIALSNRQAASDLVARVFDATDRLAAHPESGRHPVELSHLPYREVVVNPCRVIYKLENTQVLILHVVRQERDLRRFLLS